MIFLGSSINWSSIAKRRSQLDKQHTEFLQLSFFSISFGVNKSSFVALFPFKLAEINSSERLKIFPTAARDANILFCSDKLR